MGRTRAVAIAPAEVLMRLLRAALGTGFQDETLPKEQGSIDWNAVCSLAREQTVSALVCCGISVFPVQLQIPDSVSVRLMMDSGRTERRSRQVRHQAQELVSEMRDRGFSPVLMKGPEAASFYPQPDLRASGDIDLFFPENEYDKAIDYFTSKGLDPKKTPDGSCICMAVPADIDIHRRYYDLRATSLNLPSPGSPEAVLLMLSSHILKHAMGPGVGLRQICDIAMAYQALEGKYDKDRLRYLYKRTGLKRWNVLLCSYLAVRIGVDPEVYDRKAGPASIRKLDNIIFSGGNFGHFANGRASSLSMSTAGRKTDTLLRLIRRAPFGLKFGGREYLAYLSALVRGNLA